MSGDLRVFNCQRDRGVDLRLLRRVLQAMLEELLATGEYDLTVQLVNSRAMARLNEKHLQHEGPTDVITLDYGPASGLAGEVFVCVDEAVEQARRFRADWPVELTRYAVHGVLHLSGHDDRRPAARRRMKSAENRWVKKLDRRFHLSKLARKRRLTA